MGDDLSPLDGRYAKKMASLAKIFSEFSLVKYRLSVEIKYLFALEKVIDQLKISGTRRKLLTNLAENFSTADFEQISEIEKITRHDVKAIEYFISEKLDDPDLSRWVHWGLTSEDINNLAQGLQLQKGQQILVSQSVEMLSLLLNLAEDGESAIMLARTHGQPAVPTTLGKELLVHIKSLYELIFQLEQFQFTGKLTGAVGTLAGHYLVFPKIDWLNFSKKFVKSLNLKPEILTTQVLPPQNLMSWFGLMSQSALLLQGMSKDVWWYISYGYFDQEIRPDQIGSSTMPQKVNPILFENAEGNLEIAANLARTIANKLAYSRLQRDLSDSTVRRNIGVVFGHQILAVDSITNGLKALKINSQKMSHELNLYPEILAEGAQLLFKASGEEKGYEIIKELTRGKSSANNKSDKKADWQKIAANTKMPPKLKNKIISLEPESYLGWTNEIVTSQIAEIRANLKKIGPQSDQKGQANQK